MALTKVKILGRFQIFLGIILTGMILWFYWPILVSLAQELTSNEDYSFGLLLPVVAAYIVYLKWPQLRQCPRRPSWSGLIIMAFGLSLYIGGELAADLFVPRVSFVVVLAGVIILLSGWRIVRQLGFPIFLLLFTIPWPSMVTQQITLPLQLVSSNLAAWFLRAWGIPLILQGNVIDLGVRQLQVVEACSGLRYVLSLLALGFIYCYFFQRCLWKVAVLIIAIIPSAIIANALRVAAMGIFPALQDGFLHSFSGWLIFVFCFAILALLNLILNKLQGPLPIVTGNDFSEETTVPLGNSPYNYSKYLIAGLILVLTAGPLALRMSQAPPVPLIQNFGNFPMMLGAWRGQFAYIAPEMVKATGADSHLNAEFLNGKRGVVTLWIAYYESQLKSKGSIHSPKYCLPGGGWNTLESGIRDVNPGFPVQYMLMEQAGARMMVYYWYIQGGRWIASEYARKYFMGYDGLVSRHNNCALVRLITPVSHDALAASGTVNFFCQPACPCVAAIYSRVTNINYMELNYLGKLR